MARNAEELRQAKKLMRKPPGNFISVDLGRTNAPKWMTRGFQNNWYVVMIDDNALTTSGRATKAMIQRHDDAPIHSWSELQHIKNEIFGKETIAVEYYPKQSEVCDMANIYWLWIYPDGVLPIPINHENNKIEIKQLTKQQCIMFWQNDEVTEEDTNDLINKINNYGFHKDVPIDAQAAMRSWANCEPRKENLRYIGFFAEMARLCLGLTN